MAKKTYFLPERWPTDLSLTEGLSAMPFTAAMKAMRDMALWDNPMTEYEWMSCIDPRNMVAQLDSADPRWQHFLKA